MYLIRISGVFFTLQTQQTRNIYPMSTWSWSDASATSNKQLSQCLLSAGKWGFETKLHTVQDPDGLPTKPLAPNF